MSRLNVFSGNPLDRASERRRDEDWLGRMLEAEESRFLPLWKLNGLVKVDATELAWARSSIRESAPDGTAVVLLGVRDEIAHFAVDVSGLEKPEVHLGLVGAAEFSDVRAVAAQLPAEQAAILAQARAMLHWHENHRFCPGCGSGTRSADAGYMRVCDDCETEHFPQTNPVVIMLVEHDDRCLLGRQGGWPAGFVSALAGFVEPGETIEEAVAREVLEEAGIEVRDVAYHSSQPWPFPSSLMIGCHAQGVGDEIVIDGNELESAGWFGRAAVREALANGGRGEGFFLPPPMAIAHVLVRAWAEEP